MKAKKKIGIDIPAAAEIEDTINSFAQAAEAAKQATQTETRPGQEPVKIGKNKPITVYLDRDTRAAAEVLAAQWHTNCHAVITYAVRNLIRDYYQTGKQPEYTPSGKLK